MISIDFSVISFKIILKFNSKNGVPNTGKEEKMIDYTPFWHLMEESSETWYTLSKKQHVLSASVLSRLKHNQDVSLETIDKLCRIFQCQPGDLMRYIPSEDDQRL